MCNVMVMVYERRREQKERMMGTRPDNENSKNLAMKTLVGITAPTTEDWSNEFELDEEEPLVIQIGGSGSVSGGGNGSSGGAAKAPIVRGHSRSLIRSIDWAGVSCSTLTSLAEDHDFDSEDDRSAAVRKRTSLRGILRQVSHPKHQDEGEPGLWSPITISGTTPSSGGEGIKSPPGSRPQSLLRRTGGNSMTSRSSSVTSSSPTKYESSSRSGGVRFRGTSTSGKIQNGSARSILSGSNSSSPPSSKRSVTPDDASRVNSRRVLTYGDEDGTQIKLRMLAEDNKEAGEEEEKNVDIGKKDQDFGQGHRKYIDDSIEEGDDSDEESDWDAEFRENDDSDESTRLNFRDSNDKSSGDESVSQFQAHLQGLRNIVEEANAEGDMRTSSNTKLLGPHNVPRRWLLTATMRQEQVQPTVVRYPKPTALYSLRTENGMRFFQEIVLESWLSNLIPREGIEPANPKPIRRAVSKAKVCTSDWSEAHRLLCWSLYSTRQDGYCAEIAMRYFRVLGSYTQKERKRRGSGALDGAMQGSTNIEANLNKGKKYKAVLSTVKSEQALLENACEKRTMANRPRTPTMKQPRTEEENSLESEWDNMLRASSCIFHLGTMSLARAYEAHSGGDLKRSRGTTKQLIPPSVHDMVAKFKTWALPMAQHAGILTFVMLLEAECVAHQLASSVMVNNSDDNAKAVMMMRNNVGGGDNAMKKQSTRRTSFGVTVDEVSSVNSSESVTNHSSSSVSSFGVEEESWPWVFPASISSAVESLSKEARLAETVLCQLCSVYTEARAQQSISADMEGEGFDEANWNCLLASSLCDIQLMLSGRSPITTNESNKLSDALLLLQLELESYFYANKEMENSLLSILDMAGVRATGGVELCIAVVHAAQPKDAEDESLEWVRICSMDPEYRMRLLSELYPTLPSSSPLKAKVAFALAHHTWDQLEDGETAEELFFECLYILDNLRESEREIHLYGELGTNALTNYADVLVENNKYKYAIQAYESAARSFRAREKSDYSWLFRKLCSICVENADWNRALVYHLEILHSTKLETNLNEFVYVSERVAMMLLDQHADFSQAEAYLRLALSYLVGPAKASSLGNSNINALHNGVSPISSMDTNKSHHLMNNLPLVMMRHSMPVIGNPTLMTNNGGTAMFSNSNYDQLYHHRSHGSTGNLIANVEETMQIGKSQSSMDAHTLALQIKLQRRLALVLLAGNRAEDAAMVLSNVLGIPSHVQLQDGKTRKTGGSRVALHMLLATACLKLRWLADCTIALDQLAQELTHGKWCDPKRQTKKAQKRLRPKPSRSTIQELLLLLSTSSTSPVTYCVVRAKCLMYQGLPLEALEWLDAILDAANIDVETGQKRAMDDIVVLDTKLVLPLGQIGRLFYYRGRVLQSQHSLPYPRKIFMEREENKRERRNVDESEDEDEDIDDEDEQDSVTKGKCCMEDNFLEMCSECGGQIKRRAGSRGSLGKWGVLRAFEKDLPHGFLESSYRATELGKMKSVRSFWHAFGYFEVIADTLWQAKTLSRIAEIELSAIFSRPNIKERLFAGESKRDAGNIHSQRFPVKQLAPVEVLERISQTATMAIDLCSDLGYAPLMLRCLLNMAELKWLEREFGLSLGFWHEGRRLLNGMYLSAFQDGNSMEDLISFPSVRVPSIHTPPGTTLRIWEHSMRLIRLAWISPALVDVSKHAGMVASCSWLLDECWKQHANCTRTMVMEHTRTPLYDAFLLPSPNQHRNTIAINPSRNRGSRLVASRRKTRTGSSSGSGEGLPPSANEMVASLSTQGMLSLSNATGADKKSWRRCMDAKSEGDSSGSDAAMISSKASGVARKGSFYPAHRRAKSEAPLSFSGASLSLTSSSDRDRRRRSYVDFVPGIDEDGCSRCKLKRGAETMMMGRRTNVVLWSRFHRLKLLAHGQVGQTLHMDEVRQENISLLRSIFSFGACNRSSGTANEIGAQSNKEAGTAAAVHAALTAKAFTRVNLKYQRAIHLCAWDGCLTGLDVCNNSCYNYDGSELGASTISEIVGTNRVNLQLADARPTIQGASDLLRALGLEQTLHLIALVLGENSILLASSMMGTRFRAIEALLALIRPLRWQYAIVCSVPTVYSNAIAGLLENDVPYLISLHSCGVSEFVRGIVENGKTAVPTIVNLDDGWLRPGSGTNNVPDLPHVMQYFLSRIVGSFDEEVSDEAINKHAYVLYEGMEKVFAWLFRFYSLFVIEAGNGYGFDSQGFLQAMYNKDHCGAFMTSLIKTRAFLQFVKSSTPFKSHLDELIFRIMSTKTQVYRSLVGVSMQTWAMIAVSEESILASMQFEMSGPKNPSSPWSRKLTMNSIMNRSYSAGSSLSDNSMSHSENLVAGNDMTKLKRKWIVLMDNELKWHYGKSKTREKGSIVLDPSNTRIILPKQFFYEQLYNDEPIKHTNALALSFRRTKTSSSTFSSIDSMKNDVVQHETRRIHILSTVENKLKTITLRFFDIEQERIWTEALIVRLLKSDVLIGALDKFSTK